MSVDFNALFSVTKLLPPLDRLPDTFEHLGEGANSVIERWRNRWVHDSWQASECKRHPPLKLVEIVGPGGFSLLIAPQAANLYHCSPWGLFITDAEHCLMLRRACWEIAQLLGSKRAIYLPELTNDGFFDGQSLEQMETTLEQTFGDAAPTIRAIAEMPARDAWHPHCYYIDDFSDMLT